MASKHIDESQHAFRFLDVEEEPQKQLPPIPDYTNTSLVSLNQAIISLEPIISDIKLMVQIVKTIGNESDDSLTRDESDSIKLFLLPWHSKSNSLFHILNRILHSSNSQHIQPWLLFLRLLMIALYRLPSTPLIVYRGVNMNMTDKYPKGANVTWWGFSSCMKKSNLLMQRLFLNKTGTRTLFIIKCYSARDVSRYSTYKCEGEVLLPPARQFNVVNSVYKRKGLHIIELDEIQPIYDIFNIRLSQNDFSIKNSMQKIQFQPISTVSLSKKTFPAALPNPRLEEFIAYIKPRSSVDLSSMNLTDSDMDIVVSEIINKRQCTELNLFGKRLGYGSILRLTYSLRTNKVRNFI